jgi:integrase
MSKTLTFSDGSFFERNERLYVQGTINGKRYKKSINKKATSLNKKWIKKQDPIEVLLKILGIDKHEEKGLPTFEEFGLEVLEATSQNRSKQTQDDYVRIFRISILPYFKDYEWHEIKPFDLMAFFKKLISEYSSERSKRTKSILKTIISSAYDEDFMPKNPFDTETIRKHYFKQTVKTTQAYSVSEAKEMLTKSKGWLKIYLELGFKYGLRSGELMGLKWEDFDLEKGYFKINRSISKGIITESSETIHANKNHLREIYMFPETIDLLKAYSNFRFSDEWLFVAKEGKPYKESQTIINHWLKPFLKEIGVEYKTGYAMRRTYVSIMKQSEKVDLSDIQEVVGHAEGSHVTEKHYNLDVLTNEQKQEKARLNGSVFNFCLGI